MKRNQGKKVLAAAIIALGCISADITITGARFYVGKFLKDRPLPFKAEYFDVECPNFVFAYSVYADNTKADLITSYTSRTFHLDTSKSDPLYSYESEISATYLRGLTSYYVEFSFAGDDGGWWQPVRKTYTAKIDSHELGYGFILTNPKKSRIFSTNRDYCSVDEDGLKRLTDSYYISENASNYYGNVDHSVKLRNFVIGYYDSSGATLTGNCRLEIYTNPNDWEIGTLQNQNGRLYRSIPLTIMPNGFVGMSGMRFNLYYPALTSEYAVDRYDCKMYPASKASEDPNRYFLTRDLFLPFRNGKEGQTHSFCLRWFGLNQYLDTITFDFTVTRPGGLFGSCAEAEYCVGLGDV